jgi:PAS domain S-box-containing protein
MMALPTAILFTLLGAALVASAVPRKIPASGGSAQPFARADNGAPIKFFFIFAALSIGIIAAGAFYYRSIERKFINEVSSQLSAIVDLKVSQLAQWRRERLGDAALLLRNRAFAGLVRRFLTQPADADPQHQLQDWLGKYPGTYDYDEVRLMDAAGVSRLTIPAGRSPPSDFILQRSLATLRSGRVDMVDLYLSATDGRVYLALLVPVFDEANASQPLGVLVLRVDPTLHLFPSIQGWPVPSRTAETLLVRREGHEALYLNNLRFRSHAALELRLPLARRDLPAARAILGETGTVEGTDYRDVPVLAALRGIPDSPWFLIAKLDHEEAYAQMRGEFWQIFATVVGFLFAAGAGVGLVWRDQRGQFFQRQMKAVEELRASEFRYRRLFEATKDGVLILEAETGMVIDVNPFLVELLGFSREEFQGKKVWELGFFKDIVANQANFAELQRKEYIRYENLALETKTGRRIEVEFTSNVYLVNDQKVIQCDIRDISHRKQAEAALRENELKYRALFETAEGAILLFAEGRWVDCNARALKVFGCTREQIIGAHPSRFSPPTQPDGRPSEAEVIKLINLAFTGLPQIFQWQHCRLDGAPFAAEVSLNRVDLGGKPHMQAIVRDISERKQAEVALRQQAEELRLRNEALGRFNTVAVGRELRMIELKREINALCGKAGEPPRHRVAATDESPR